MIRVNLSTRTCAAICIAAGAAAGCGKPGRGEPAFCVTVPPLAMIVAPLAGGGAGVTTLLAPGASPHTHELAPSDARDASDSLSLFYVGETLDAWAGALEAPNRTEVMSLIPADRVRFYTGGDERIVDPHFWLDPTVVRALIDPLVSRMAELDPSHQETYLRNAETFGAGLDALDHEIAALLEPVRGAAIVQHHPSMAYFLARYGFRSVGAIEESPGQEPTPRDLQRLAETMKTEGARVVVTEPQLPPAPVRALAEMTGARIVELDPVGGLPGRMTYAELLRYNARTLADTLK